MASPTYDKIASIVLDSSASSVTFDDIPTTDANSNSYKDLVLVIAGTNSASGSVRVQFNDDTSSAYTYVDAFGNGSSAYSSSGTLTSAIVADVYTTQSNGIAHIMDYSNTSLHKTILARGNAASGIVRMVVNRWANTSAITKIKVFPNSGSFNSGVTFDLYAIAG